MKLPLWIIAGLLACNTGMMAWDHRPRQNCPKEWFADPAIQSQVDREVQRIFVEREARRVAGY